MSSAYHDMKGKPKEFWDAFEREIGKVMLEDSPNEYANASSKHQHTANDIRMMAGYRVAIMKEALKRVEAQITNDSEKEK